MERWGQRSRPELFDRYLLLSVINVYTPEGKDSQAGWDEARARAGGHVHVCIQSRRRRREPVYPVSDTPTERETPEPCS
ncbi:unnamed protein product [Boreogadus saida]